MIPTEEIIPGFILPEEELVIYAKNQPEYLPLPVWKSKEDPNGRIVIRWKLSWRERFSIFFRGSIWHSVLTFNQPLQPIILETKCPLQASFVLDKEK